MSTLKLYVAATSCKRSEKIPHVNFSQNLNTLILTHFCLFGLKYPERNLFFFFEKKKVDLIKLSLLTKNHKFSTSGSREKLWIDKLTKIKRTLYGHFPLWVQKQKYLLLNLLAPLKLVAQGSQNRSHIKL